MSARLHEPGIYLGMPTEEYHADPALGSSDIRTIIKSPRKYWLRSPLNPQASRYRRETEATALGTALHCYLLDGAEVFHGRYVQRPDDPPGASSADKGAVTRAANKSLRPGQTLLHGDEWALVHDAGAVITAHPQLSKVFANALHEVSVFWIDKETGVRCKCRFDILKPRGIGDIKTIANEYDQRLDIACKIAIKYRYKYHIQAEHYLEGRRQLPALFENEQVFLFGARYTSALGTVYDSLKAVAAEPEFAFQLVFISKSLPEVWACNLSPGNPILEKARSDIDAALLTYVACVRTAEALGAKAWPETWKLDELDVSELPGGEFGWD